MAGIVVTPEVRMRNSLGRFIADCDDAGHETVEELIEDGAKMSRAMAPRKTGDLKASIRDFMVGAKAGVWVAAMPYAMFQEEGTAERVMVGNEFFSFFWDNAGRMWIPGLFGSPDIINHPGNPPQPYLRPAYEAQMARAMTVAAGKYPG